MQNITIIIIITIILTTARPTLAAWSTPSANVQTKLEELKKEIASKAAKLKQEVNQKLQNRAYVGLVKSRSDRSVTLATKNASRIINITQDTGFESHQPKVKFNLNTIKEDDYMAALGDIDENGVLTAKKVVLLNKTEGAKVIVWGQIISITPKFMTVSDQNRQNVAISLISQTEFIKDQKPAGLKNFSQNDLVVLTGSKNREGDLEALLVAAVSSATTSATMATSSAKP